MPLDSYNFPTSGPTGAAVVHFGYLAAVQLTDAIPSVAGVMAAWVLAA